MSSATQSGECSNFVSRRTRVNEDTFIGRNFSDVVELYLLKGSGESRVIFAPKSNGIFFWGVELESS
jgi:hypothetical protein